jgi:hypothetical protein
MEMPEPFHDEKCRVITIFVKASFWKKARLESLVGNST